MPYCKHCGEEYHCRRRDFLCCAKAINEIEGRLKDRDTIGEDTGTSAVPNSESERIAYGFRLMKMNESSDPHE